MALTAAEKQEKLFQLIETFINEELEAITPKGLRTATKAFNSNPNLSDPRTGAKVTHVHTTLSEFIGVSSLRDNFYQRRLQNHLGDKIYKNLIISILEGHLIPELRVAALANKTKLREFDLAQFKQGKLKLSIIDGLQRYCCFLIALYLAAKGESVVSEGIINPQQYQDFAPYLKKDTLRTVLEANIRLEVYYNLEVKDLLKYMIIFNTAQKRMSLNHQLEIMEGAILQNLEENHKATFERDTNPGTKRNKFTGADLVLAIQAYLQQDHTLSKNSTTDDLFHNLKADESLVDIKIEEICKGVALMTNKLHPVVQDFYEEVDEDKRSKYINILTNSTSQFVVPMMASLGRFVEEENGDQTLVCKSLSRIIQLFKDGHDAFDLDGYYATTDSIKSSRGATIKNLAERGFRNFWLEGKSKSINWAHAHRMART